MKFFTPILVIALLSPLSLAHAGTPLGACKHTRPYSSYIHELPKTFVLVPPCPDAVPPHNHESNYSFKGETTISGIIDLSGDTENGGYVSLIPNNETKLLLPIGIGGIDFKDNRNLQLPHEPVEGVFCWQAPATIHIKDIEVINDDTDASGSFPVEYKVLSIGAFVKCPTPSKSGS
jgi:hypothetical protein